MKDREVVSGVCGHQGYPRGRGAYDRLSPELGCSNERQGEEEEKGVGWVHVRREGLSRDATVVLCYPWWLARGRSVATIYIYKHPHLMISSIQI